MKVKKTAQDSVKEAVQPTWLAAVRAAESKKATDIKVLDLTGITSFADYFVICTGSNSKQVQAIADEVGFALKKLGEHPISLEGYAQAEWILADYGDLLVHVFSTKAREYYDLQDHADRFEQSDEHIFDRRADEHSGVVRDYIVDAGREALLGVFHVRDDLIRGVHGVCARGEKHDRVAGRFAVKAAEAQRGLRAQFHAANVANPKQRGVGLRANHNVRELTRIDQTSGRTHRILEVGSRRRRRLSQRARRVLAILGIDRVADVRRCQPEAWPSCPGLPKRASNKRSAP